MSCIRNIYAREWLSFDWKEGRMHEVFCLEHCAFTTVCTSKFHSLERVCSLKLLLPYLSIFLGAGFASLACLLPVTWPVRSR